MQIHSTLTSNQAGAQGTGLSRELPPQRAANGGPSTLPPSESSLFRDRLDLGGAEAPPPPSETGMTPEERLDAFAQKYLDRIDALMQKEGLTREQVTALQEARDAFEQNVDRFASRFLGGGGAREGMGGAIGELVGALRSDVREALGSSYPGDSGDWLGRGSQG